MGPAGGLFAGFCTHTAHGRVHLKPMGLLRTGFTFVLLLGGTLIPVMPHAEGVNVSGAVALSSQLVNRGQAITPDTPILQGALSWTLPSGWALGLSAGTEVKSPGPVAEAFAQVSRNWSLSADWQTQASVAYYNYRGAASSRAHDQTEANLSLVYRDVLTFGVSAIYALDAGQQGPKWAADVDLHWPLPWSLTFTAGLGIAQSLPTSHDSYEPGYTAAYDGYGQEYGENYPSEHVSSYGYGHLGLIWSHGPWRVELDRVMIDPDKRREWGRLAASPWLATISWSF